MPHSHSFERRDFLKLSARLAALGLTGLGLGANRTFFAREVSAAGAVADYRALVCIYLAGGNDSNNMIVPVDATRYTQYQAVRGGLAMTGTELLAPISDGRGGAYALHYGLAEMNPLYESGRLAIVLNVGQLQRPLTRDQYRAGLTAPSNLFSHSDQTLQAYAGEPTLSGSGWGGRLLDCFNISDNLAAVSVASPALFLDGNNARGNVVPPGASLQLSGMNIWPSKAANARRQAVNELLQLNGGSPIRDAANRAFAEGLQLGDALAATSSLPPLATVFPTTSIGNQLKEVARLVRMRASMGPGRQVFFCSIGGWDTHSSQEWTHWNLLQQVSKAMDAFYQATVELGLAGHVTTFTQSEFNRTFQTNGSGTDHAWGSHQLVLGGSVRGGIYGEYPTLALGGPDDANTRGVWIPKISTSQFGATLGKWFGAADNELVWAFPTLPHFGGYDIGFMA